jgi:FAD/FMN-containing dehydrogenase
MAGGTYRGGGIGGASGPQTGRRLSRRTFLAGTAGAAALGVLEWTPLFRVPAASADSTLPTPPGFPTSIPLYQQAFQNWSGEIVLDDAWTCVPESDEDVVTLANWAYPLGYQIRARGMMHNWSPLVVPLGSNGADLVLADTTQHLTALTIDASGSPATVTTETGVTMDVLLQQLENEGLGLTAHPAPGDITVGGVLAIDGHGTAIPALGEAPMAGHTYGSVSNLILSLTAVVWDAGQGRYTLRTFNRSDPGIQPLLAHLGRAFVTEVTLQVGANTRLRCQSFVDVAASSLFGAPGSSSQTFDNYVEQSGRVETIWFPFTSAPWLKVWSISPRKPLLSREVATPYNYVFSDVIPQTLSNLIKEILNGDVAVTPTFGQAELAIVGAGLLGTLTADIWGWAKNLLLYVKPSTLRVTANGYAVHTNRSNVQQVISDFTTFYESQVAAYESDGNYPMNGPVEIRVTGLDELADVEMTGAVSPQLSALRPRPDMPNWNVAVWFDILTMPGTPESDQFYRTIEQWMFAHFSGTYAMVRPEWSKGWAYSPTAAWADPVMLGTTIPDTLRVGQRVGDNWDAAVSTLDAHDPHRVFSNAFLDSFMP